MALCVSVPTVVQRLSATVAFIGLRDSWRCHIRLKFLCIDIVSLSNQIHLILPSKASDFLG